MHFKSVVSNDLSIARWEKGKVPEDHPLPVPTIILGYLCFLLAGCSCSKQQFCQIEEIPPPLFFGWGACYWGIFWRILNFRGKTRGNIFPLFLVSDISQIRFAAELIFLSVLTLFLDKLFWQNAFFLDFCNCVYLCIIYFTI